MMPQMSAAFAGWKTSIDLKKITQSVGTDGFVEESETALTVQGTWQPLSPEEIMLKPDGQRSWEWIWFHVEGATLLFKTNDKIFKNGIKYKIMAVKDYTLNNFSEYHLVLDYQAEGA